MTDPHDRAGVARSEGPMWLGGRAGRREYWAIVAALALISFVLSTAPPIFGLVLSALLAGIQARRLHDFGRSGWWALAATFVPLIATAAAWFIARSEDIAVAAGAIVAIVAIVWIGAVPGTPGDNRFGPAPPFTVRRVLTGR
jgi:uncharacterized membrane protein YhaH (DUF805 family)